MKIPLVAVFLALVLGSGMAADARAQGYGLAAKVNGVGISNEQLERSYQEYLRENNVNVAAVRYPARIKAMKRETLDLLINQELLWQEAQKKGTIATPEQVSGAMDDVQAQFGSEAAFRKKLIIEGYTLERYREHLKRLVSAKNCLHSLTGISEVNDAAVHAFYTENPDKFRVPEAARVRHILIKIAADADDDSQRAARRQIESILAELRAGGDFAALARQYSQDASAAAGGDLGLFPRGQMVESFDEAVFDLQPGEISGVVKTGSGLHIIKVEERQAVRLVPEEAVRERIRQYLGTVGSKQSVDAAIEHLRSGADVEILLPL